MFNTRRDPILKKTTCWALGIRWPFGPFHFNGKEHMENVADMAIMCICVHKLVDSGENCAKELSCGFVQGLWVHLLPFWCIVQTKQHHLIRFSVVDPQSNVFPSILTFGSRFLPHRLSTSSTGLSPEPTAVHRSIFNPLTIFRCCVLWHLSAQSF